VSITKGGYVIDGISMAYDKVLAVKGEKRRKEADI
jgi:hypothetical protein